MSHPLGTKALSRRWVWEGGEGAGEKEGMSCVWGGMGRCFCCKHTWRGLSCACEDVPIMLGTPRVLEGPALKAPLCVLFSVIRVQCRHAWEEGPPEGPIGGERCNRTQNSAGGLPRLLVALLSGSPLSGPSPGGVSGLEVLLHNRRCLPLSFPHFWNSHR